MKLNWSFLGGGGGGCKTKNLPWGEYGYFLEQHNILDIGY